MERLRTISLMLFIFAVGFGLIYSCGGGGDRNIGSSRVLKEIALFSGFPVDNEGLAVYDSEVRNLTDALRDMGHTVTLFTGYSAQAFQDALSDNEVLVIPELELFGLDAFLADDTRDEIKDFVNDGGILLAFNESPYAGTLYSHNSDDLINAVFGYDIVTTDVSTGDTLTLDSDAAIGTPFEDAAPLTLHGNDGTYVWDITTLPPDAHVLYTDSSGNAALVYIKVGRGHLVLSSWDWNQGDDILTEIPRSWWSILYRSASLNADHPDVVAILAKSDMASRDDILTNLRESGQFGSVTEILGHSETPSVSELQAYDTVMISSFDPFIDPVALGDNLADYIDGGGGVVITQFSRGTSGIADSVTVGGRFLADDYYAIDAPQDNITGYTTILPANYEPHPSLAGFIDFDGGDLSARPITAIVHSSAARIIDWADGAPLVAVRDVGPGRVAGLGFWPGSDEILQDTWWSAATDGDKLMANALTWTADLPEPPYMTYESVDPPRATHYGPVLMLVSNLPVSGAPTSITKVTVTVDISHPIDSDLSIIIWSASGKQITLSSNNGADGDDYSGTVFDDWVGTPIAELGSVFTPFSGSYIPEEPLVDLQGDDANGTWTLWIQDNNDNGVDGTLNSWSIDIR